MQIIFPVEYSRSSDIKRPSDNYENAEQVSNDTDTETGVNSEVRATRSSKHKKLLKGVENAGFQPHESNNSIPKQSESELYFGDVSSCCGPESSLYDVATEKEGTYLPCQNISAILVGRGKQFKMALGFKCINGYRFICEVLVKRDDSLVYRDGYMQKICT